MRRSDCTASLNNILAKFDLECKHIVIHFLCENVSLNTKLIIIIIRMFGKCGRGVVAYMYF